jgi:hypothetical protein
MFFQVSSFNFQVSNYSTLTQPVPNTGVKKIKIETPSWQCLASVRNFSFLGGGSDGVMQARVGLALQFYSSIREFRELVVEGIQDMLVAVGNKSEVCVQESAQVGSAQLA